MSEPVKVFDEDSQIVLMLYMAGRNDEAEEYRREHGMISDVEKGNHDVCI